jgi:hypothetical protein
MAYPNPVKGSDESLTSFVRRLLMSATAYYVCIAASGSVPASRHDGGDADIRLRGGEREGSNCFLTYFSEVFSATTKDLYFFLISWDPLY